MPLRIVWSIALVFLVLVPCSAWARDEPRAPVTKAERDEAILRGLRHLDATVLGLPDTEGTPTKPFTVATTGVVKLLAGSRGGSARERASLADIRAYLARYVERVAEGVRDPTRLPGAQGEFRSDRLIQYTWPVAMTGIFFGELHARGKHEAEARRVLKDVRTILRAAQRTNGGWGHHETSRPADAAARGYPDTLLCTSWVVASALGLLEGESGRALPKHLADAVAYFRAAQLDNGNYPYDPSQRSAHRSLTGVSRAAGATFALWTLGVPWRDKAQARSLDFIDEHFDYLNEGHGSSTLNLLYGALLQRVRGKRAWKAFRGRYFRPIVDGQAEDGSFACICESKAFGATNDTDPFAAKPGRGVSVRRSSGDPALLERFTKGTKTTYVSALHVLILLLDRTSLELLDSDRPKAPDAAPAPVTPRGG